MIIELTGIPGAGKSTILKNLKSELNDKKYIFDVKKYILGFSGNTFVFDMVLLVNFFRLTKDDRKSLSKIFKILKQSKNSTFHKINILRNSYKKFIVYRMLSEIDNRIFFIDEGISHIPFTLFVDISKSINIKEIDDILEFLPKVDKILNIDADDEILLERVIQRGKKGHRRMDFSKKENIVKFMQQSRQVLDKIKHYHNNFYTYINIDENIKIKEITKLIGLENV
jgi:thymidylate kinase